MLFETLVIKCVVQLELIQAIDHIVFFHNTSRQDDRSILDYAQVSSIKLCLHVRVIAMYNVHV